MEGQISMKKIGYEKYRKKNLNNFAKKSDF